jgi:hypothetical protein
MNDNSRVDFPRGNLPFSSASALRRIRATCFAMFPDAINASRNGSPVNAFYPFVDGKVRSACRFLETAE